MPCLLQGFGGGDKARIGLVVAFDDLFGAVLHLVDEVLAQIRLAQPRAVGAAGVRKLRHGDIGLDAGFLHAAARRREIARRGQAQRRYPALSGISVCTDPLPKLRCAQHDGAALVLQGAGDDFGGRGRAFIDEDDDRAGRRVRSPALAK